jgi:ubiquinone/menaquinone biosynthesis C-methylase UbiE
MAVWREHVVPRFTDVMLGTNEVRGHRQEVITGLRGEVVEIGFGSGLNVPLYPADVEMVYAIEPSEVGRKLAAKRVAASRVPIRFVGLDGQDLPLDGESVDAALSTFTLCTIPDVTRALDELRRVLRPGGRFHFLEHGLCPEPATARWQHRLNGLQQRFAGGCNLDRPIDQLVREAGFQIQELRNAWFRGPPPSKPWGYLYEGAAIKPAR